MTEPVSASPTSTVTKDVASLTPDQPTSSSSTTASVKPGVKTSEWWLSHLAILLTILYASNVIPTGDSPWGKVAAIAATVLTAFGYTVVRGRIKSSAISSAGDK